MILELTVNKHVNYKKGSTASHSISYYMASTCTDAELFERILQYELHKDPEWSA